MSIKITMSYPKNYLRTYDAEMEADWKSNSSMGEDFDLLRPEPELHSSSFTERVSSDGINLLPTDDQLDQLVDNLCDTFSTLKTLSPDLPDHGSLDLAQDQITSLTDSTISSITVQPNTSTESAAVSSQKKRVRIVPGKRSTSNTTLNMSMTRCSRYLEHLRETRKSLEAYVRSQPHILPSITRLPQSPTRVDRLIFEVDRERCRVLGLIASLDSAVQAFSATSTKDDLRYLLDKFRRTIIDVTKERHNEVNALEKGAHPGTRNRAIKLAQFINEVILLIREADTALWCLKQQVLTLKSRKRCFEATSPNVSAIESANRAAQSEFGGYNGDNDGNEDRSQERSRRGERSKMVAGVPRTNVLPPMSQSPSFSSKSKKSSAMQLLAQQQRAEIFQRYASTLNITRKDSTV